MVKTTLLGMFLAVVAMAATANAAVMNFHGNVAGSGTWAGRFDLSFDYTPTAPSGNTANASISNVSLSFYGSKPAANFDFGSIAFTNRTSSGNDVLKFDLTFDVGSIIFEYVTPFGNYNSNSLVNTNLYTFMNKFGTNPGVAGGPGGTGVTVFGESGGIQAVPEPGSMACLALLTSGVAGFAVRRRRKKA